MQSDSFKLSGQSAINKQIFGDLFVYEAANNITGNERIIVKPNNGNEIVLKAGQSFRLTEPTHNWLVRLLDSASTVDVSIVVGSGEFWDSNVNNKFVLDASFANNVTVQNPSLAVTIAQELEVKNDAGNPLAVSIQNPSLAVTIAQELEVKNDAGNPLAVTFAGVQTVQEQLIAATGSAVCGGASSMIVSPAANANGIIIHAIEGNFMAAANQSANLSVLFKNGVPANQNDGSCVGGYYAYSLPSSNRYVDANVSLKNKIKIPAGVGLYYVCSGAFGGGSVSLTYTIL